MIISAGMPKSASTAGFNLLRFILEEEGHTPTSILVGRNGETVHNFNTKITKAEYPKHTVVKVHLGVGEGYRTMMRPTGHKTFLSIRSVLDSVASAKRRCGGSMVARLWGETQTQVYSDWVDHTDFFITFTAITKHQEKLVVQLYEQLGYPAPGDDKVANIVEKLSNISTADWEKTFLTPNHITDPERKLTYRDTLSESEIARVLDRYPSEAKAIDDKIEEVNRLYL